MILACTKRFFMEKMAQIRQIFKEKYIQIARFLSKVPVGSQEYRRILFFYFYV
jgi:hypothetical protein